jgi:hypothetical protein
MHLCAYRLKVPQKALLLYPPQGEAGKGDKKRKMKNGKENGNCINVRELPYPVHLYAYIIP